MTPAELVPILRRWADEVEEEGHRAMEQDQMGRLARCRGQAKGLRMAAAELYRITGSPP